MKIGKTSGIFVLILASMTIGLVRPVSADDAKAAKPERKLAAFWELPKEDGKLTLVMAGQKDPVTVAVSDATVIAGICLDCNLPMEFKTSEAKKTCSVCGCLASNAACIVGKPVKSNTWQAMLKMLPHGVLLSPTFNEADKPESGVKKLAVSLRALLLPVTGLEGQTPEQLLALVKPLGGTKAELIDSDKLLSVTLKSDWTVERATKLEKALAGINAKIVVPEEKKAAQ